MSKETKEMLNILHENCKKAQERDRQVKCKQIKERKERNENRKFCIIMVLIIIALLIVICICIKIDNDDIKQAYNTCLENNEVSYCDALKIEMQQ